MVTDIDGTITDPKRRVQCAVVHSLRRLQEEGIHVMLASGNVLPVSYGLHTYIGLTGPIIAENGGVVSYGERIFKLSSNRLPLQAFEFLKKKMPVERLFTDRWRETQVALKLTVNPLEVRKALEGWEIVVETTGYAIHLMEPGHSKLNGVRKACELLGIDVSEVAAFGDSDNDVSMLKGCGTGIAVANATEAAKNAADYVTKMPYGDGVIEGLEWLGLLNDVEKIKRSGESLSEL